MIEFELDGREGMVDVEAEEFEYPVVDGLFYEIEAALKRRDLETEYAAGVNHPDEASKDRPDEEVESEIIGILQQHGANVL